MTIFLVSLIGLTFVQEKQDPGLGLVNWKLKLDDAVKASKELKRPILAMFKEVPG